MDEAGDIIIAFVMIVAPAAILGAVILFGRRG